MWCTPWMFAKAPAAAALSHRRISLKGWSKSNQSFDEKCIFTCRGVTIILRPYCHYYTFTIVLDFCCSNYKLLRVWNFVEYIYKNACVLLIKNLQKMYRLMIKCNYVQSILEGWDKKNSYSTCFTCTVWILNSDQALSCLLCFSCIFKPGMNAILGPSGCGKSSYVLSWFYCLIYGISNSSLRRISILISIWHLEMWYKCFQPVRCFSR